MKTPDPWTKNKKSSGEWKLIQNLFWSLLLDCKATRKALTAFDFLRTVGFSFFYDYEGGAQLIGAQKATAVEEIFDRLTQDIINASLANW